MPFPAWSDREAWSQYFSGTKTIASRADSYLGRDWRTSPTSNKHREALGELILSELAIGKGKYINEIENALKALCEREFLSNRSSDAALPPEAKTIDLMAAAYGSEIAIAWHFFHDKISPEVSDAVLALLKENIFDPFLDPENGVRPKVGWLALHFDPVASYVNNWVPYCNFHVLLAFLLAEKDPDRLLDAVARSARSMDVYMDYAAMDGSCEEGASYWNMAGAKVYEYAMLMKDVTCGKIDLLGDGQIRRMGEWRIQADAGDNLVINFSDSGIKGLNYSEMYYRIGKDCGSKDLVDYAILSAINPGYDSFRPLSFRAGPEGNRVWRALENLRYKDSFKKDCDDALALSGGDYRMLEKACRERLFTSCWYPDNQQAFLRSNKFFLFAKGGHNLESHNHNDVGSFILFDDSMPVLIDPGSNHDTYTALHRGNKYVIWSARSEWHNLPMINGCQQYPGRTARTGNVSCDPEMGVFSADLAPAYPKEAACKSWVRSYKVSGNSVVISDTYDLEKRVCADTVNFIVWKEPALPGEKAGGRKARKNEVLIPCSDIAGTRSKVASFRFPAGMKVLKQQQEITDKGQKAQWGATIWRIRLVSPADAPLNGSYRFEIRK